MNACLQMLVEPIIPVTTPLDRTDVNAQLDLLLLVVHRSHLIQFVLVRSSLSVLKIKLAAVNKIERERLVC